MMRTIISNGLVWGTMLTCGWMAAPLLAADGGPGVLPPPADKKGVTFEQDIKVILQKSCVGCHGPRKQEDKIRLDSLSAALQSGKIKAGQSAQSKLVHVTARLQKPHMPPKGKGDPLTAEQVGLIRAWIDQGAK